MDNSIVFTVKFGAAISEVKEVERLVWTKPELTDSDIAKLVKMFYEKYKDANTGVYYICIEIRHNGLWFPVYIRIDKYAEKPKTFMSAISTMSPNKEVDLSEQIDALTIFYHAVDNGDHLIEDIASAIELGKINYNHLPEPLAEKSKVTFAYLKFCHTYDMDTTNLCKEVKFRDFRAMLLYCRMYGYTKPAVALMRTYPVYLDIDDIKVFKTDYLQYGHIEDITKHIMNGMLDEDVLAVFDLAHVQAAKQTSLGFEL